MKINWLFKQAIILIVIMLCGKIIFAQSISGFIIDSIGNPIQYCNIIALNKKDLSLIKGCNSPNGAFILNDINAKEFIIRISQLGYKDYNKLITSNKNDTINLGTIKLTALALLMNEVVVSANIPLIEMKNGNLMLNINNTALKNEESTENLLRNAPSVIVSPNGGIEVFGKGKPLILINGKEPLNEEQVKTLKPSDIKNIEIINNPGAKYDASYKSVINITTLHKSLNTGIQLYNKTSYSDLLGNKTTIWLNHDTKKISHYATYSFYIGKSKSQENFKNIIHPNNGKYYENTFKTKTITPDTTHTFFYGFDYSINKKNNIGFQINGQLNKEESNTNVSSKNKSDSINYTVNNKIINNNENKTYGINLNYTLTPDTSSSLIFLSDYFQSESNNSMSNEENILTNYNSKFNKSNINYEIKSAQIDYNKVFGRDFFTLYSGLKYSDVKNNNLNKFQELNNNVLLEDSALSSKSNLNEKYSAAYASLSKSIKKINFSLGIRAENSDGRIKIKNTDTQNKNDLHWFPSASVSYPTQKGIDFSLSYRKGIERIGFQTLSQDLIYINPYVYRQGNPYLKPAIIDNFTFNIAAFQFIFLEFNYAKEKNKSYLGFYNNDSIVIFKEINLNRKVFTAGLSFNINSEKLSSNTGFNLRKTYSKHEYLNQEVKPKGIGFALSTSNTLSLTDNFEVALMAQYTDMGEENFTKFESIYNFELGIKRYFLKKSLRFSIYGQLNKIVKDRSQYGYVDFSHELINNPYQITFSILYKLKFSKWISGKSSQDEEKNRL